MTGERDDKQAGCERRRGRRFRRPAHRQWVIAARPFRAAIDGYGHGHGRGADAGLSERVAVDMFDIDETRPVLEHGIVGSVNELRAMLDRLAARAAE